MIENGALVFFEHPQQSWILGTVTAWDGKKGSCKGSEDCGGKPGNFEAAGLSEEQITIARDDTINEDKDDLMSLTILHDSTILRCLRIRYMRDVIYTNIGPIVVALNPFNFKIPWYTDDNMPKYIAEGDRIENNLPHSWAVAHNTYYELMNDQQDQCILVSGESGAGKTEASKIVMKYLANVSTKTGTEEQKAAGLAVGGKINMTGPPLESWGNAKTVRNNNSSRFGKFMKVRFNPEGLLVGAFVIKYLLEKSRIVTAGPGERCYHTFYLAIKGKDSGALLLDASNPASYSNLNAGKCLDNPEFNTAEEYQEVCESLVGIGVDPGSVLSMWKVVAGVMHSQNIEFDAAGEGSQMKAASQPYLDKAASVWGVPDKAELQKELCLTTLYIQGKPVEKLLTPAKAADCRDSLSKHLYDNEFSDLIETCNRLLDKSDGSGNWVGLLDIFGFEDFETNSFEQVCINLANESLQGHYNTYIFARDMDECRAEGIDVTSVVFPDNSPCLQMVSGKGGLMSLLDEECSLGKGSDEGFLSKLIEKHGKNPFFGVKKLAKDSFLIHHYAKSVNYTIDGFLEKNRDTLKDAFKIMMRASSDAYIQTLLPQPDPDMKKMTVGGFYKTQLKDLMDLINTTNPHWIRCVKPHPAKKPLHFDGVSTFAQLSSAGVLGTVKIRKAGFPIRLPFPEFYMKYRMLGEGKCDPSNPQAACATILAAVGMEAKLAQMGKTRVFMKTEAYIQLETKKKELLSLSAVVVQAWCTGYCAGVTLKKKVHQANQEVVDRLRAQIMADLAEKRAREAEERRQREEEEARRKAEEEAARKKWEEENAEQVRREEEARRAAELADRMANASQALVADDAAARSIIAGDEDAEWRSILAQELEARNAALFRAQRADVEREEEAARRRIIPEEAEGLSRLEDLWEDLSARGKLEAAKVEAQRALAQNRAEREKAEAARRERARAADRTLVERLVVPKQPAVNAAAQVELAAKEEQRNESLRARAAAAAAAAEAASPQRVDPHSPPRDGPSSNGRPAHSSPARGSVASPASPRSPPPRPVPGQRVWVRTRAQEGVVEHLAPGDTGQLRVLFPSGDVQWCDSDDIADAPPSQQSRIAPLASRYGGAVGSPGRAAAQSPPRATQQAPRTRWGAQ